MSAGEEAVRLGLGKSVADNELQVAITDESRRVLADLLEDRMRIAVAEGISAAMTEEAAERFWSKGLEVLQRQAKEKAGGFLLDGLATAAKKLLWIGLFVVMAYSVGGWSLLKTVWAAMHKGA